MANRELLIAFVYDTQRCTQEADDPQDAVLFFHPGWVSEQQRLALCGQLMGATYFLLATFSRPRILSLQSGKFAIRTFGRYVMVIGTDRNIPEWVLEQRAETMTSLLKLYFDDLEVLAKQCEIKDTANGPSPTFTERLGRIFETFLPIVQYTAQILGNVPTVRLPKSASNVFLEAMQILRGCQEQCGVLGGTVLYQNKVVASQLSPSVTKQLVLSDPYRIKSPGTTVETPFRLPLGAQLLQVFISHREFRALKRDAEHVHSAFSQVDSAPKVNRSAKDYIPCLKKDKQIFTVLEEDDREGDTSTNIPDTLECTKSVGSYVEEEMCLEKDEDELQVFEGGGSRFVCSTPLRDLSISKVLHAQALSICSQSDAKGKAADTKQVADVADNSMICDTATSIPDVVRDAVAARCGKWEGKGTDILPSTGIMSHAMHDLHTFLAQQSISKSLSVSLPSINTNNVPLRYYSLGLPVPTDEQCSPRHRPRRCFYNTITDPCFPVFRHDGLPLSRSLFDEHIANHYRTLDSKPAFNDKIKSVELRPIQSNRHSPPAAIPLVPVATKPTAVSVTSPPVSVQKKRPVSLPLKSISNPSPRGNEDVEPSKEKPRPLRPTSLSGSSAQKPLSLSGVASARPTSLTRYHDEAAGEERKRLAQHSLPSVARPTSLSGGIPLTPLMSKLSQLAMDRYGTVGTPAGDPLPTPCETREQAFPNRVETPMAPLARPLPRLSQADLDDAAADGSEEAVLLVCGFQSMTLFLMLQPGSASDAKLLTNLWEIASSSLERLEQSLNHSLDHFPSSTTNGTDSYSFLCVDPAWDAVHKGGVWSGPELELVGSLHRDFRDQRSLTEICVRVNDSLVYGYQCGQTEVFYQQQQPGQSNIGLPTPADLMGTVPLKARRRLERDHGIVLL